VSRALAFLIALQARGWVRFLGRNLRTVRGALTALLGASFFLLWLLAVLIRPEGVGIQPETLRRNGPAFLLLYCLMNVFISTGERAIYFSPGEVNFLFAGPFGRREILAYKIALTLLVSLPSSLILTAIVRVHAAWFVAAYVALLLAILFQQLFGMAVNLIAITIGARAYTRSRRLLLAAVIVLAVTAMAQAAGSPGRWRSSVLLETVTTTSTWHVVSTPLRWFFDAFLAERLWPDLVLYASLAMSVNLVLLVVVFSLDAQYLEAAASSSARIYAQIQRFRRGGMAAAGRGGRARFSLPDFPFWGGIGPVLWRQLTTATRGLGRLALVLGLIGLFVVVPLLAQSDEGDGHAPGALIAGLVVWLTVFLTQMVPFDFRGDVDRIAALKALPLAAWRLALGQLLAPVFLVTGAQWATLAAARILRPEDSGLMLALAAFAPPFNFLLFALENSLFLRFPVRVIASTPGDFQSVGRNLMFMVAKLAALLAVGGGALAVGLLAGLLTWFVLSFAGHLDAEALTSLAYTAGGAAAWLVLALSALALLPIVALAFNAFDVGRDTPA
jgi:hypothetical protein